MSDIPEFGTKNWWERTFVQLMSAERRALLGTVVFFLTIVAVGWQMINEPDRLGLYEDQYNARSIERGAVTFNGTCSACHGPNGQGISGVAPGLNYESFFDGTRLADVGYSGTVESYVQLTVASGRPAKSSPAYPNPMPTWAQEYGGPMRPDQVRDVVAFVMNWGLDPGPDSEAVMPFASTDVVEQPTDGDGILSLAEAVMALEGDATQGEAYFMGDATMSGNVAFCKACHTNDGSPLVGPSFLGIFDRFPGYTDYVPTDEDIGDIDPVFYYILESVFTPDHYKSAGFENGVMPPIFAPNLTEQEYADLIAYIYSINE